MTKKSAPATINTGRRSIKSGVAGRMRVEIEQQAIGKMILNRSQEGFARLEKLHVTAVRPEQAGDGRAQFRFVIEHGQGCFGSRHPGASWRGCQVFVHYTLVKVSTPETVILPALL